MTKTAVSNSASKFIVPAVFNITAKDDDFTVTAVADAQLDVSIGNIDQDFTSTPLSLSEEESLAFLNSFTMTPGNPADAAGTGGRLSVALSNPAPFKAAIKSMIDMDGSLKSYLDSNSTEDYTATILKVLGVKITDDAHVNVTVNSDSGADSAAAGLTSGIATTIYLQIPQAQLEESAYMDTDQNHLTNALPLNKGDTLVFVFDVTTTAGNLTVLQSTQQDAAALASGSYGPSNDQSITVSETDGVASGAATAAGGKYAWHISNTSVQVAPKRVAFALKMSGTNGGYAVGAGGLRSA